MANTKRPVKSRKRTSQRRQWIVLLGAATALLGVALLIGRQVLTGAAPIATRPATAPETIAALPHNPADREVNTGSILFTPQDGDDCRQYLFDNRSGRMSDNGVVDCAAAAYHPATEPPKQWSAARLNVISSGFRLH